MGLAGDTEAYSSREVWLEHERVASPCCIDPNNVSLGICIKYRWEPWGYLNMGTLESPYDRFRQRQQPSKRLRAQLRELSTSYA